MSANSKIEWTDHTFNPWIGCTKVSPGCAHCYAETLMDTRYGRVKWGKGQERSRTSDANWKLPLKWNSEAARFSKCGECGWRGLPPRNSRVTDSVMHCPSCDACGSLNASARPRVFCASLADWLDDEVPIEWLADLLDLIRRTPNLDWLLLTKRPENWLDRIYAAIEVSKPETQVVLSAWAHGTIRPLNIMIGTTTENQEMAEKRHKALMIIPARIHFWSTEPMLSEINAIPLWDKFGKPEWVIVGGESGPNARPMHLDWARSLRDQCQAADVPFFFKQWGEWAIHKPSAGGDLGGDLRKGIVRSVRPVESDEWRVPNTVYMKRVGKKSAGRILDGREWNEMPGVFL